MEAMRLCDPDRLRMLIAAVAYLVALQQGLLEAKKRPIKIKHSPRQGICWPEVSVFRYGLRAIVQKMRSLKQLVQGIKWLILRKMPRWNPDQLYQEMESV